MHYPDLLTDRLLTAENAALLIVDFQPAQIRSVATIDQERLVENAAMLYRVARLFGLPVVLSALKLNDDPIPPTVSQITEIVPDAPQIVRSTLNPWEDVRFLDGLDTALGAEQTLSIVPAVAGG